MPLSSSMMTTAAAHMAQPFRLVAGNFFRIILQARPSLRGPANRRLRPEADDLNRRGTLGAGTPISQLAGPVAPPALDAPLSGQGAGVQLSRFDGGDPASEPGHVHGQEPAVGSAIPQLANGVESPAQDVALHSQRAGMPTACGHGDSLSSKVDDIDRQGVDVVRGPDAQLAFFAYAPALDAARGH